MSEGGIVSLADTTFADNEASITGGGAQVDINAQLEAIRTTFEGNRAVRGGCDRKHRLH